MSVQKDINLLFFPGDQDLTMQVGQPGLFLPLQMHPCRDKAWLSEAHKLVIKKIKHKGGEVR